VKVLIGCERAVVEVTTGKPFAVIRVFYVEGVDSMGGLYGAETRHMLGLRNVEVVLDGDTRVAWCDSASPLSAFSLSGRSSSIVLLCVPRRSRLRVEVSRENK
jgi:hypothetical protein